MKVNRDEVITTALKVDDEGSKCVDSHRKNKRRPSQINFQRYSALRLVY